jgi:hypothetical protein
MSKNKKNKEQQEKAAAEKGGGPAKKATAPGAGGKKAAAAPRVPKCGACDGKLVELEDYTFHQRLRRAAACMPAAAGLCIAWALLYSLIRLIVGGKLGAAGAAGLAALVGQKLLVGIVLGVLLGAVAGIWRTDVGLFLGVVIGSLGGFFAAAAPGVMPLLSDAAHRADVVAAAVLGGILSGATVLIAHSRASKKFDKFIGPEPHAPAQETK